MFRRGSRLGKYRLDRRIGRGGFAEVWKARALRALIVQLACDYGGYGIPRILELLGRAGVKVNRKRLERIWREEGLKVPKKQIKRRRLWLNDGSCIRHRLQSTDPCGPTISSKMRPTTAGSSACWW